MVDTSRLEQAVVARIDAGIEDMYGDNCTGCISGDPTTKSICSSVCLTPCEQEELANQIYPESPGLGDNFIFNGMAWTCRYAEQGYLPRNFEDAPFRVYSAALLVAMLQLTGGVATVIPQNEVETVVFFIGVAAGAIIFAAIQGVVCGVFTNGDPDEIAWRQNME